MKRIKEVPHTVEKVVEKVTETRIEKVDDQTDAYEAYMGKHVCVYGMNYIYYGKLTGVNTTCIEVSEPRIVYETGAFTNATFKDAQKLPTEAILVQRNAVESIFVSKQGDK